MKREIKFRGKRLDNGELVYGNLLKPNGVLVFKWNEEQIPTSKIISVIGKQPLFGHTGTNAKTIWMFFIK